MRTISTGMRPELALARDVGEAVVEASTVTPSSSVTPVTCGSKAKPRTHSRSTSSAWIASRAAFFTYAGLTVPYCGPIAIADPAAARTSASLARSPIAWM